MPQNNNDQKALNEKRKIAENDLISSLREKINIIQEKLIHKFILYQHLHLQYQVKYNLHVDL